MSNGMRGRASQTAARVDARLAEMEGRLITETTLDWESLRPRLSDAADYERLMTIVDEATQQNESIGELVNRLKALGAGGADLLAKVKTFIAA